MSVRYNAATLVNSIRRVGGLSSVEIEGTDTESLLVDVYEVIRETVIPNLLSVREEHLVRTTRIPVTPPTTRYRIPARAIGNALRDYFYVDSSGNRFDMSSRIIPRERLAGYNATGAATPQGWFPEGNYIQLVPVVGSYGGFLELSYFLAPSQLVLIAETGRITSLDLVAKTVTLEATPPASFVSGTKIDIHSPESGAEVKLLDLTLSGAPSGNVLTFSEAIDGTTFGTYAAAVGDYVCLARECAIVQVPEDSVPLIIQSVALRHSMGDGNTAKAQMHAANVTKAEKSALTVFSNRVEGKPPRVRGYGQVRGCSF